MITIETEIIIEIEILIFNKTVTKIKDICKDQEAENITEIMIDNIKIIIINTTNLKLIGMLKQEIEVVKEEDTMQDTIIDLIIIINKISTEETIIKTIIKEKAIAKAKILSKKVIVLVVAVQVVEASGLVLGVMEMQDIIDIK